MPTTVIKNADWAITWDEAAKRQVYRRNIDVAFDGNAIYGVATPGGDMFSLARGNGATNWVSPIADGTHYQSVSTAEGVVWTVDGQSNLDGIEASSGAPLVHRPLAADAGAPVANLTSSGVAIAERELFVAAGGASYEPATGYVIAYGAG